MTYDELISKIKVTEEKGDRYVVHENCYEVAGMKLFSCCVYVKTDPNGPWNGEELDILSANNFRSPEKARQTAWEEFQKYLERVKGNKL